VAIASEASPFHIISSAGGLKRAENHSIPFFVVEYSKIIRSVSEGIQKAKVPNDFDLDAVLSKQTIFPEQADKEKVKQFFISRSVAEAALLEKMNQFEFHLLVLAGFMRNLTPYFIDRVNMDPNLPRIMNIHPALLPSFPGVDGYGDTFRYGCKVGGCTVHFIDYGEDSGPIIGQKAFAIEPHDTLDSIKEKGLKKEWELYPECIRLFAENRLKTEKKFFTAGNGKTVQQTVVTILK